MFVIVVALFSGNVFPCGLSIVNDRETRLEMEDILRTLWNGTPEQRLEAAERAFLIAALIDEEGLMRCWPHRHDMDGFFAARLERTS